MSRSDGRQTFLLVWAICASAAAIAFAGLALFFFVRGLEGKPQVTSPFLTLQESDVVGRYRYFESGNEAGIIELYPNHSFRNRDGTTYPQYRWEILRDGLLTVWQKAAVTFRVIERPGVYVALREDGSEYRRIEKLE
jgi:hypothetical protein